MTGHLTPALERKMNTEKPTLTAGGNGGRERRYGSIRRQPATLSHAPPEMHVCKLPFTERGRLV